MPDIDLARVLVSPHASHRWRERVGIPEEILGDALRRSVRPDRHLERMAYHWLARGNRVTRMPYMSNPLRVDRETGAVFALKIYSRYSDGTPCWSVATVTHVDLVRGIRRCTTTTATANARA